MKRFFNNDDDDQNFFEEETDDYEAEMAHEITAFISSDQMVGPLEVLHAQFECDLLLRAVDLAKESTLFWGWRSEEYQIKRINSYFNALLELSKLINIQEKGEEDASV
jgi:hypothetical protein